MIDKILDAFVFVVIYKKGTVHIIIIKSCDFAKHIKGLSALGAAKNSIGLTFIIWDIVILFVIFIPLTLFLWYNRTSSSLCHVRNPTTWSDIDLGRGYCLEMLLMSAWSNRFCKLVRMLVDIQYVIFNIRYKFCSLSLYYLRSSLLITLISLYFTGDWSSL